MRKILSPLELSQAIKETNARKGYPIKLLCDPLCSYVPYRVLKPVGAFRDKSVGMDSPRKLLDELDTLPDRPLQGILGLFARLF